MDVRTQDIVIGLLGRETSSLLQYLSESFPWPNMEDPVVVARLNSMIREQQSAIGKFYRLLARHLVPPPLRQPFPSHFTTINFVALDHLMPLLAEEQRRLIAALEKDLEQVTDQEVRNLLQLLLAKEQEHLQQFKHIHLQPSVATPTPHAVAAAHH